MNRLSEITTSEFKYGEINIGDMKRYLRYVIDNFSTFALHCRGQYAVPDELIELMHETLLKERFISELRLLNDSTSSPESISIDLAIGTSHITQLSSIIESQSNTNTLQEEKTIPERDAGFKKEEPWGQYIEPISKRLGLFHRKNGGRQEVPTYKMIYF